MITARNYAQRIKRLQKSLAATDVYLISSPSEIQYYTGFSFLVPQEREAFFICTDTSANLIYSSFSPIQNFEFINYFPGTYSEQFKKHVETILTNTQLLDSQVTLLYDPHTLFVIELQVLEELQKNHTNITLSAFRKNPIAVFMMKKDRQELALLKQAATITSEVFSEIKNEIKLGVSEAEVVRTIEEKITQRGATLAFPTIVAFGANAAAPHHQPSNKVLEQETAVLIDMGAKYHSYCSDMTRTFWFGSQPSKKFKEIESIVQSAYSAALDTITQRKQNVTGKQIDNAARTIITNNGFGDNFIHTTGHGLGLEIHEKPSLSWADNTTLEPQSVFTIEPGIYLEDELGYRHENTILLTKDSAEELTT